jgi:hypothetical protein
MSMDPNEDKGVQLSKKTDVNLEERSLIEALRTRMNVLNTSVFLLSEKIHSTDKKTNEYIRKINSELEHIRSIITKFPEPDREE